MKRLLFVAALAAALVVSVAHAEDAPPTPYVAIDTLVGQVYVVTSAGRYTVGAVGTSDAENAILEAMPDLGPLPDQLSVTAPAPPVVATPPFAPITLSGAGTLATKPFALPDGNYTVDWSAKPYSNSKYVGCYHGAHLKSVDGGLSGGDLGGGMVDVGKTVVSQTQLYNVKAGQFYIAATSGCAWTITFSQLR